MKGAVKPVVLRRKYQASPDSEEPTTYHRVVLRRRRWFQPQALAATLKSGFLDLPEQAAFSFKTYQQGSLGKKPKRCFSVGDLGREPEENL